MGIFRMPEDLIFVSLGQSLHPVIYPRQGKVCSGLGGCCYWQVPGIFEHRIPPQETWYFPLPLKIRFIPSDLMVVSRELPAVNFGVILLGKDALVDDNTPWESKIQLIETLSVAVARQWFLHSVTPKLWDHRWTTEAPVWWLAQVGIEKVVTGEMAKGVSAILFIQYGSRRCSFGRNTEPWCGNEDILSLLSGRLHCFTWRLLHSIRWIL